MPFDLGLAGIASASVGAQAPQSPASSSYAIGLEAANSDVAGLRALGATMVGAVPLRLAWAGGDTLCLLTLPNM